MISKKPGSDLIRAGYRFSEKMMLHQKASAGSRCEEGHRAPGPTINAAPALEWCSASYKVGCSRQDTHPTPRHNFHFAAGLETDLLRACLGHAQRRLAVAESPVHTDGAHRLRCGDVEPAH